MERRLRVAIIGNSNSLLRHGYTAHLDQDRFDVRRFVLGACPNAMLLYALTMPGWDTAFDWIVIETSPTDQMFEQLGLYGAAQRRAALTLFLEEVMRRQPGARVLALVLPFQATLAGEAPSLTPELLDGLGTAARPVVVLDIAAVFARHAAGTPLAGVFMADRMHPSPPAQIVVGRLLACVLSRSENRASDREADRGTVRLVVPEGVSPGPVRINPIVAAPVHVLGLGQTARWASARPERVLALVINRNATSCGLRLSGGTGSHNVDLRCRPDPALETVVSLIPVGGNVTGTAFAIEPLADVAADAEPVWENDPAQAPTGLEFWGVLVADAEALDTVRAPKTVPIDALADPAITAAAARLMADFARWQAAFSERWLLIGSPWLLGWAEQFPCRADSCAKQGRGSGGGIETVSAAGRSGGMRCPGQAALATGPRQGGGCAIHTAALWEPQRCRRLGPNTRTGAHSRSSRKRGCRARRSSSRRRPMSSVRLASTPTGSTPTSPRSGGYSTIPASLVILRRR